jgi:2,4-dienoyl-CoA reductase-like NADH-dependent reductase (Old Yellow Enzyme family)
MLFTPIKLGNIEIKNRVIRSSTFESMGSTDGEVTEGYIKHHQQLAKGGVGLCITGSLAVHPLGKLRPKMVGIYDDRLIPGLKKVVDIVHDEGGKIAFQLFHAGRQVKQEVIGQVPMGPSAMPKDPTFLSRSRAMTEAEIQETIRNFGRASNRAAEAGADAVQIMAAHGYLVNQFLSPFYNHRNDEWGNSPENQFRFLKEIILEIKKITPDLPILIKLNTDDYTPSTGITKPLAVQYAKWLAEIGIAGLEITSGTTCYSFMNTYRGEVPVDDLVRVMPFWKRPLARWLITKTMAGKYPCTDEYHLDAAGLIKPVIDDIPLILVGGVRNRQRMEEILNQKQADIISMSRPLIREPFLVNKMMKKEIEQSTCISCNKCLTQVGLYDNPVGCYAKKVDR